MHFKLYCYQSHIPTRWSNHSDYIWNADKNTANPLFPNYRHHPREG